MCTSANKGALGSSGKGPWAIENWVGNTFWNPGDWAAQEMGYSGDGINYQHQLAARLSGGETNQEANTRQIGIDATRAMRQRITGAPQHARNIARSERGPSVRPIAGRVGNTGAT